MPFNLQRTREIARPTCLRDFAGRDSIQSVVFDATSITPDADGRYIVPIGTFLTRSGTNPTRVKPYQGLGTDTNARQTVTITGTPTGGSFTLTVFGQTTRNIAYNAAAADVVAALVALSSIGPGDVRATGGALPGSAVIVEFQDNLGAQVIPTMTADGRGLTGGTTPAVTVTTTTPGTTAEKIIGVFDGPRDEFWDGSVNSNEPVPMYWHSCVFDVSKIQNWSLYETAAKRALYTCQFY